MLSNRTPVERKSSTPPYAHNPEMAARVANGRHHAGKVLAEYRESQRPDPFEALWWELERIAREQERIVALLFEMGAA